MDVLEHRREPWTFDDLLELPESLWKFEIVDGALMMTQPVVIWHQLVSANLRRLLDTQLPDDHLALGNVAVDMDPTYLIPDLFVIHRDAVARDRDRSFPTELSLVIEIVYEGSESADRVLKPALYAAAGIPNYWRVETRPSTSLTAYTLPAGADAYTELGTWSPGETARISEPFDFEIPITDLER